MLRSDNGCYYWVVRKKLTNNFMGLVSLDPHHDEVYPELSYQFLPKWWGKGYATEVVQFLTFFALNELKLSNLIAETQTANKSSCRLLERIGMKFERSITRFGAEQAIYSIKKVPS
nr:GNAT family N-acetyltransferase [Bacillus sp. B1-b2]